MDQRAKMLEEGKCWFDVGYLERLATELARSHTHKKHT